ncbi:MAG: monofunctional biosynthetic peptidoglycan transglycosylase [Gammaproteobacteria bacterium]|nr:monofunctional biosynthetic peptidoglycan transglycosylase [Gammaproteobacteria bacterium]
MNTIRAVFKYLLKKLLWLSAALILVSVILVASLKILNPPVWGWKLQRQIIPPDNYPLQIQHQWLQWDKISNNMKLAVIASEDQLFTQHSGFDFDSIMNALDANAQGKPIRGASTISQQTAKNLFLWPSKSFVRKGIEAWFTVLMELMLEKQRVLELYLNLVEFGPGIFGVEAASQQYYNKSAQQLSVSQSARLASVLPNPYRFHVNKPSPYIIKRTQWIEKQMRQLGEGTLP